VISHSIGFILSVVAIFFLLDKSILTGSFCIIFCSTVFGFSSLCLYGASTLYHREKNEDRRLKLKIFDHSSIYILIAGSYTPFLIITLHGFTGNLIFIAVWSIAIIGIILKFFFTGRLSLLSTISYVLMGWIIVFAFKPLYTHLSPDGFFWLLAGGVSYTVGALLYQIKKLKFNHAIFHIFVLIGTICHFISIYFYVI
jgi:hemolysin III